MKKGNSALAVIALAILLIGGFFGFRYYKKFFGNNVEKEGYILIPHSANMNSILDSTVSITGGNL